MIEELTKDSLIKYGFDLEAIKRLETWENYNCTVRNNLGDFHACNVDQKIYTGIDALGKIYFRNENLLAFPEECYPLMLEYYDRKLIKYFDEYSKMKVQNYSDVDKVKAEQYFIENEIEIVLKKIGEYESELIKYAKFPAVTNPLHNKLTEIQRYLDWLKIKKEKLTQKDGQEKKVVQVEKEFKDFFKDPAYYNSIQNDLQGLFNNAKPKTVAIHLIALERNNRI